MRKRTLVGITIALGLVFNTATAYAGNQVIKFDYSKSLPRTLSCPGISIPITYDLIKPLTSGNTVSIDLYHQGKFEQTIQLKAGSGYFDASRCLSLIF